MKLPIFILTTLLAASAGAAPLHSNPLAPNVLYLDCSRWTTASDDTIAQTWLVVARLYNVSAHFNVDVTTDEPLDGPDVARIIIGGLSPIPGAAGQSPINVWHFGTLYRAFGDAFTGAVWADTLGNDPTLTGVAVAHEAGHLFGEYHTPDGVMAPNLTGLIPDPPWPAEINNNGVYQDTYADLSRTLGVYAGEEITPDVPEPHALLLLLPLLLMRRQSRQSHERPASLGTSQTSSIDAKSSSAFRRASSRSAALTYSRVRNPIPETSAGVPMILNLMGVM